MRVKALTGLISLFAVLMLITSCSSKKVKRKPTPLAQEYLVGAKFNINWTLNLDADSKSSLQVLQPYIDENEILTVSTDGFLNTVDHDGKLLSKQWIEPTANG